MNIRPSRRPNPHRRHVAGPNRTTQLVLDCIDELGVIADYRRSGGGLRGIDPTRDNGPAATTRWFRQGR